MRKFLASLKKKFTSPNYDDLESESGYLEIDTEGSEKKAKAIIRPFVLEDFEDVKAILDVLREGRTIALVNIAALRNKDLVELKRAINKLKKTCDAINGEIAGFSEDFIVITPSFATIQRTKQMKEVKEQEE